ncbi:MAG: hypothetical protein D6739_11695, partial [Nitrospirae bacterium]
MAGRGEGVEPEDREQPGGRPDSGSAAAVSGGPEAGAASSAEPAAPPRSPAARIARQVVPWIITAACFWFLYRRLDAAAARAGTEVVPYLAGIFASVDWSRWLLLMVAYSGFFFLIDSLVLWRVVSWFNTAIPWRDLLPVRASTYILSIVNEQVGKGAIALYLNRTRGVPGWQIGSSMLFIMVCEFYYLATWATVGSLLRWNDVPAELVPLFHSIPLLAGAAWVLFAIFYRVVRSERFARSGPGQHPLLHAFRQARLHHYLAILLLRSPALLAAVVVYSLAARLFGVELGFGAMLGFVPVVFFATLVPG